MATSILTLVQDFTEKMGLPTPTALVGSNEKSVKQYRSIVRDTINDLLEYSWQEQTLRATFTSLAAQNQGALTTIFGAGYFSLVPDSLWNATRRMRIFGPVSEQVWQALQALPAAGPEWQCWVSNTNLYITPTMVAGDTLSGIYRTKYGVTDSTGVTAKERVTVDSDLLLFPDNVFNKMFEAKWQKQKGEGGWEDTYNEAIGLIAKNKVKSGSTKLAFDAPSNQMVMPGIVIPSGSWNV